MKIPCFSNAPLIGMNTLPRGGRRGSSVSQTVGIETANPRQSGANLDLFHVNLAIPYQGRIDIRFVSVLPNASP